MSFNFNFDSSQTSGYVDCTKSKNSNTLLVTL